MSKKIKPMEKKFLILVLATTIASACSQKKEAINKEEYPEFTSAPVVPVLSDEELIKRGSYIVATSGCHDCHSPKIMTPRGPEPDPTRLLSGHNQNEKLPPLGNSPGWVHFNMNLTAASGPWGTSYAANLTPDDTGIGAWSFENFKTAIRKGKLKGMEGSRDLLPPMPWQMYKNMTDEDLSAVFHYLKSLKPVNNLVPAPIPPKAS
jgi:hypothetical protein